MKALQDYHRRSLKQESMEGLEVAHTVTLLGPAVTVVALVQGEKEVTEAKGVVVVLEVQAVVALAVPLSLLVLL